MQSVTLQMLLEHDETPGRLYENCLMYGGCCDGLFQEMDLYEATDESTGTKNIKFRGKLQEADAVNKNNRRYTKRILEQNVKSLNEALSNGGLVGELDHPSDSIVHFSNSSHKIDKLWWEGNVLMGEGTILSTPSGKVLKALISDGVRIGMSSRGVGNGKVDGKGVLVIDESYKLITFDAVADPSTYAAFQERVVGTQRESVIPPSLPQQNNVSSAPKNEASSIHNVTHSKELVLAALSGIVKRQTNEIKARLH